MTQRDKRQTIEALRAMRSEGKTLPDIALALGISVGYAGWLCFEHDIPKTRKKDLIKRLQSNCDPVENNCGAVSPKES